MTREHDDDIVRRVDRTLTAVAEATPIAPPLADDLRELVELADTAARSTGAAGAASAAGTASAAGGTSVGAPADAMGLTDTADQATPLRPRHVGRNGHGLSPRSRPLALAAAVLAVALATAATWMLRPNGDNPPAVQVVDGSGRLEAGWLPEGLGGTGPEVTATSGLDIDLEAASYRPETSDGTMVMAAGDMLDAATVEAVAGALTRLTRADETTNYGAGGEVHAGGRGTSSVSWGNVTGDQTSPIVEQVTEGTRPADVRVGGMTTIPITIDWVPGIAASVTTRYGDPVMGSSCRASVPICPDAWVEVATTAGDLPEPELLGAVLPGLQRLDLGDRTAWMSTRRDDPALAVDPPGRAISHVVWQEADGVIGSVAAHGLTDADVQRIARQVDWVDGASRVPVVQPRHIGNWSNLDGTDFSIEAWEDSWRGAVSGPTTMCWRVRIPADVEPPVPVCGGVDGTFHQGRALGRNVLFGAIVTPEVHHVETLEGPALETFPAMSLGDDVTTAPKLAFVIGTEAEAHDAVASLLDANGNVLTEIEVLRE